MVVMITQVSNACKRLREQWLVYPWPTTGRTASNGRCSRSKFLASQLYRLRAWVPSEAGGPRGGYPTLKVRKGGGKEIPLVQGKEQWLHFAGAAVNRLLISWLQSPSAVILEPRKIKADTVSTVSPSISHEVVGPDAMIFIF